MRPKSCQDSQSKKFADTARVLGCDEDEAAFDEKLKRIARHKPPAEDSTAKGRPSKREDD